MNNFITNQGQKNLQERLVELIKASKELKFIFYSFKYKKYLILYNFNNENK